MVCYSRSSDCCWITRLLWDSYHRNSSSYQCSGAYRLLLLPPDNATFVTSIKHWTLATQWCHDPWTLPSFPLRTTEEVTSSADQLADEFITRGLGRNLQSQTKQTHHCQVRYVVDEGERCYPSDAFFLSSAWDEECRYFFGKDGIVNMTSG